MLIPGGSSCYLSIFHISEFDAATFCNMFISCSDVGGDDNELTEAADEDDDDVDMILDSVYSKEVN